MHSLDRITLRGMRFHALVGVLPHERELPQPLEVDLTVWVRPAPPPDGGVVDYRALYAVAADVVGGGHTGYLEELAGRIAEGACTVARVARARVAVRKPHVPLPGPVAYAEVAVDRVASA